MSGKPFFKHYTADSAANWFDEQLWGRGSKNDIQKPPSAFSNSSFLCVPQNPYPSQPISSVKHAPQSFDKSGKFASWMKNQLPSQLGNLEWSKLGMSVGRACCFKLAIDHKKTVTVLKLSGWTPEWPNRQLGHSGVHPQKGLISLN